MVNLTFNNYGQDMNMDKVDERKNTIPNIIVTTQGKILKIIQIINFNITNFTF